jgi:hypothetical protein
VLQSTSACEEWPTNPISVTCSSATTGSSLWTNAVNGRQQFTDFVRIELALDVALDLADATAQRHDVLACVPDLELVRLAVMGADGNSRRFDKRDRQLVPDAVASGEDQLGETPGFSPAKPRAVG